MNAGRATRSAAAALLLCLAPLAPSSGAAPADASPDAAADAAKLDALRGKLAALAAQQQAETDQRDATAHQLRDIEQKVALTADKVRAVTADLAAQQRALEALQRDRAAQLGVLRQERGALAGQVRAAYVTGREERFKLLLNQQDPAAVGRMLVYYDRFNQARGERIGRIGLALEKLAALGHEIEDKLAVLEGARRAQASALADLQAARADRKLVLARLDTSLHQRGAEIQRVTREAEQLRQLLDSIGDVFADAPFDGVQRPFAKSRGRLPWPARGKLLHRYGELRAEGRLRWEGLLIASEAGKEVRCVAPGRVAFADWLPHYGMLMIVEHGDGYMSLYGHNQALYKRAGEWVQAGETIAATGDSGGQDRAALYFEVRKGKEPLDPRRWLARR